ncbi:MAG: 16S rRNA (uracil(1498)-N(3))-methyltransferase [Oscillospiraceae bacterium]|nr:16S rRNA (uracil(1498)-N(3))-methyltransferase [Oscillospiraceae bacterium]
MPRFFIDDLPENGIITLKGENAVHIGRSLRSRIGDRLILCRQGTEYETEIVSFTKDTVSCRVISSSLSDSEPNVRLTLLCALPKSDKAETVIQKCTELGASSFVFFETGRCVARFGDSKNKIDRFQKVALEAAKQSGRGIIPSVTKADSFEDALKILQNADVSLFCYEKTEGRSVRFSDIKDKICTASSIAVMTGPEGGFDPNEAEKAALSADLLWLGKRILRCETAPIAVTSALMMLCGEL